MISKMYMEMKDLYDQSFVFKVAVLILVIGVALLFCYYAGVSVGKFVANISK